MNIPPPRNVQDDPAINAASNKDRIVQQTDIDALLSRCSAVEAGYLDDPFALLFVEKEVDKARRYPLINRGTYIRTTAIDQLVYKFLEQPPAGEGLTHGKKQIISLGAGSDTRFFRLLSCSSPSVEPSSIIYHEFDFPEVTSRKISSILKHKGLSRFITDISYTSTSLTSANYHIHSIDLRNLHPDPQQSTPLPPTVDTTLPTLFISECCLIYLSPTQADDILKWITTYFPPSTTSVGLVIYEPIGGEDAFGKVMIQNLAARGIVLKTLKKYSTLRRQKERMRIMGFGTGQEACDVEFIHDQWITAAERERIDRLEMLDEREEWMLLARHYCIAWGWRENETMTDKGVFDGWRAFKLQEVAD